MDGCGGVTVENAQEVLSMDFSGSNVKGGIGSI